MSEPVLEVDGLVAGYGPLRVLHETSLRVNAGEVVTLLGANGAGKTTTLAAIVGLIPTKEGRVRFMGADLRERPPERIVRDGIALVPEGRRVFGSLTVDQNLQLGGVPLESRKEAQARADELYDLFPHLRERSQQAAGTLSGGEQQMLAIARALMSRPRLLLLDEPSLGLAPIIVEQVFALIDRLRTEDTTMLLVEQNVRRALEVADRAYLMNNGRVVHEERAESMLQREDLDSVYLVSGPPR